MNTKVDQQKNKQTNKQIKRIIIAKKKNQNTILEFFLEHQIHRSNSQSSKKKKKLKRFEDEQSIQTL